MFPVLRVENTVTYLSMRYLYCLILYLLFTNIKIYTIVQDLGFRLSRFSAIETLEPDLYPFQPVLLKDFKVWEGNKNLVDVRMYVYDIYYILMCTYISIYLCVPNIYIYYNSNNFQIFVFFVE